VSMRETRRSQSTRRLSAVVMSPLVVPAAMLASALPALADPNDATSPTNSPGAVAGNLLPVPTILPISACGNSALDLGP
jgi:hypothetical protein